MHRYIVQLIIFVSLAFSSSWVGVRSDSPKASKPAVLSSTIQETFLQFEFDGYHMIEAQTPNGIEYIIDLEGGSSILDAGAPDLDHFTTSIVIPDQGTTSIEVVSSSYRDYENVMVAPSKGNLSRSVIPSEVEYVYNDSYNQDSFYPGTLAELRAPYILRDLRGQAVVIYPLQYNPQTNTLRVYSDIEVKVTTAGTDGENALYRSESKRSLSREYNNIYEDLFLNYANDSRFDYIVDEGNMLIISYGDFMDEMQPLVDWKNRKGIPTEMVNVSSIGSSSSAIESFVDNYYYENGLTYLLLVGDIAQIPTPIVNGAASDPSYGFISGNDSFAEVIVGRFSANNPSELLTQIERTLSYEQSPSYTEHFNSALGIASNQGPGYGGYSDDEFNDFLWNTLLEDYTYENFNGIYDPSGSVSDAVNLINSGVGVINYTGHAGPTGWGNGAPLGVNDVNGLVNAGKLPFVFTVGCNPGEFNNYGECFTEAWLRATDEEGNPTGAIAHLGSTISQSWEPPMHGQWGMNAILTESYEEHISRSFGGIVVNGCMHMNEAQGASGINETNHWTTFGDPSVIIRTDEPSNISPVHDDVILIGQTEFVVDAGVNEGLVALSSANELIASNYIQDGVAVLSLDGMEMIPGTLNLVISSFNTYSYETEINVISPDGAYLISTGYELVSESSLDNNISFGEDIEINILTENVGTSNVNGIFVEVTTDDQYVEILNGSSMIAYATVNDVVNTSEPISLSIFGDVPDGHIAHFNVLYDTGDEEQWNSSFSIEISATDFQVLNPVLIDEDQNGVLDPGENALLTVDLANLGSGSFGWYPGAFIVSNSEYIEVDMDSTAWFYGIDSEMTYEWTFSLQAASDTPLGATGTISIFWGATELSTNWCEQMINGCPDPVEFIYTISIGLPFDATLATPESLDAVSYQGYIELAWDEPILFECDAEAPYNDDCYAYVIEIDPYCCDYNWDSICEGEYQECLGREIDYEDYQTDDTSRNIQEFNSNVFESIREREITGYNIFRDDDFIGSTSSTFYTDSDLMASTEYCYYVTAMYDSGQSYGSNQVCVTSYGLMGDTNGDSSLNVQDIIVMINMIFDVENINLQTADLNGDNDVSILDVIILIGMILDNHAQDATRASLIDNNGEVSLSSDGYIGGVQMTLSHDSNFSIELTDDALVSRYLTKDNSTTLIIAAPYSDYLFTASGDYTIVDMIVANSSDQIAVSTPSMFALDAAYPNPFNPSTTMRLHVPVESNVNVSVYNLMGQQVDVLHNGLLSSGYTTLTWNAADLPSGMYIVKAISNSYTSTQKLMLLK